MGVEKICHPLLISIISVGLLFGCWRPKESSALDSRAIAVWHEHEVVFRAALNGHQEDDKFDQACLFFEKTTGLHMHVNYFTLGILPTSETDQDLVRIQAWYEANKHRLYWDESTHAVKVRPR